MDQAGERQARAKREIRKGPLWRRRRRTCNAFCRIQAAITIARSEPGASPRAIDETLSLASVRLTAGVQAAQGTSDVKWAKRASNRPSPCDAALDLVSMLPDYRDTRARSQADICRPVGWDPI